MSLLGWFGRDAKRREPDVIDDFLRMTDPQNSYSDPIEMEKALERMLGGLGAPSIAGPVVTERTAMRVSTFYRCVNLISGTIASLPCEIYERMGSDQRELRPEHPVFKLVHDEPNALMTASLFWRSYLEQGCKNGDCLGLISRDRNGNAMAVYWVPTPSVTVKWSPDYSRLWYDVRMANGSCRTYDQDDILHYPFPGFDGKNGMAPLDCAREAIGLAAAAEEFNAAFFSKGTAANVALIYENDINDEQAKLIWETYEKNNTGTQKMRLPLIVSGGKDAKRLDFKADESQLMEARYHQVEDICRYFGVPPHLAGHTLKSTSWGTGIVEQTLGFEKFTLRTLLKGLEQEINRKLIRNPKFFCKFDLAGLLRADPKARAEYYKSALGGNQLPGFMTVNEVRKLENLAPDPDGNHLYVPVAGATAGGSDNEEEQQNQEPVRQA